VTGGAGFVGSHLCERLLDAGHAVVCLDDLSTGSARNLAHLIGRPGFSFIRQDVTTPFDIAVDQIYNLACPASPPLYQLDPIRTFKTNVFGALNALDLAEKTGARVLQASTSEIYGDPEVHPQPESYWGRVNTFGPRACYDEGKRAAETLFHDYRERRGVDIRIARIFNTYGPRMDPADGRVVSNFVVQALRGQDITVYGDGSQTRSFCYVDDLVEGLLRLMGASRPLHAPINLGNTGEITVLELAELVIALSGSRSRIVRRPLPTDDPRQRRPDIGRARAQLGWEPVIPLAAGLKQTIAYFDGVLDSLDTAHRVS
jgi:UDP-glucuronate decarboxylase